MSKDIISKEPETYKKLFEENGFEVLFYLESNDDFMPAWCAHIKHNGKEGWCIGYYDFHEPSMVDQHKEVGVKTLRGLAEFLVSLMMDAYVARKEFEYLVRCDFNKDGLLASFNNYIDKL